VSSPSPGMSVLPRSVFPRRWIESGTRSRSEEVKIIVASVRSGRPSSISRPPHRVELRHPRQLHLPGLRHVLRLPDQLRSRPHSPDRRPSLHHPGALPSVHPPTRPELLPGLPPGHLPGPLRKLRRYRRNLRHRLRHHPRRHFSRRVLNMRMVGPVVRTVFPLQSPRMDPGSRSGETLQPRVEYGSIIRPDRHGGFLHLGSREVVSVH